MDIDIEKRIFPMAIRAVDGDDGIKIRGTAAVYNKLSGDLGGFNEIIEPGFFENVLNNDVRALVNHDENMILGRTSNRTLILKDNESGLDVKIKPPNTQTGKDTVELIRRGDINQMSFAFKVKQPGGDKWIQGSNGKTTRILKRGGAAALYDVSVVTFPAYPQTSVSVRARAAQLAGRIINPAVMIRHKNRRRLIQLLSK